MVTYMAAYWNQIIDMLNDQNEEIGIEEAIEGDVDADRILKTPGLIVWAEPAGAPMRESGGEVFKVPVDLAIFCVGTKGKRSMDIFDRTMSVAMRTLKFINGRVLLVDGKRAQVVLKDPPLTIVEKRVDRTVIAVQAQFKSFIGEIENE